jgi:hypothetical protein
VSGHGLIEERSGLHNVRNGFAQADTLLCHRPQLPATFIRFTSRDPTVLAP